MIDPDELTPPARGRLSLHLALIRVPQWSKNLFVLAPLFFSQQLFEPHAVLEAIAAVVVFSLVASAVYIVNDVADREHDRQHPDKASRPLAAGQLRPGEAYVTLTVALAGSAAVTLFVGYRLAFAGVILSYLVMNLAYTFWLKHVPLADVFVIGSGFVLRVVAGSLAIGVFPTSWIILSTGLLALFMALGKRRADLEVEDGSGRGALAGYSQGFIDVSLGALAAAIIAFYALFTVSDYSLEQFGSEHLYLTTFPVVAGLLRYLQAVMVEGRFGSPTEIALRDRPLQLIVALWLAIFFVFAYV